MFFSSFATHISTAPGIFSSSTPRRCICADDTKEHKPSAQPLLKYMELSGARKEETVYIGDSASDMACALNAGVDCVHAVWGEPETEADATYRAGKPEQLEEIFL